jgi:glyoxylase-like metal-dependent hydrolase (beta-lactamase superfamily II)
VPGDGLANPQQGSAAWATVRLWRPGRYLATNRSSTPDSSTTVGSMPSSPVPCEPGSVPGTAPGPDLSTTSPLSSSSRRRTATYDFGYVLAPAGTDGARFEDPRVQWVDTPKGDVTYLIVDAAFIGDTVFMTDYGSARADFPGSDTRLLYRSIQRLYALPPEARLFLRHDYLTEKRRVHRFETTVAEQKQHNVQINAATREEDYVRFQTERDRGLATPKLLFASVQVNIRAGRFPPPESNGRSYLKVPIKRG